MNEQRGWERGEPAFEVEVVVVRTTFCSLVYSEGVLQRQPSMIVYRTLTVSRSHEDQELCGDHGDQRWFEAPSEWSVNA